VLAIHGQSDQMRLMRPAEQRAALDRYAGAPVTALLNEHRAGYHRWQGLVSDLADRTARVRQLSQEADLLRHGIADISAASPLPGEDEQLAAESRRLGRADALRLAAQTAHEALAGDPDQSEVTDISGLLGLARRALAQESAGDPELAGLEKRLDELAYLSADVAADLASYAQRLDADPVRLAEVEDRRAVLKSLTRKYADTIDGVLAWSAEAEQRLARLDVSEDALAALAAERDAAEAELRALATRLSAARTEAAGRFSAAVSKELAGLAMPRAEVRAEVRRRPAGGTGPEIQVDGEQVGVGPDGIDEVELLLVAHAGAPALPIQKGASGGELSRVMLAVEVVFADADPVPTMVFDEVDAGVGGRAAIEVGRRLARLARDHQVLVVTHLPQVAAYADRHVVVDKASGDGGTLVTRSDVRLLDEPERVRELSRMLAGQDGSKLGQAHAEELLGAAAADKAAFAK
jgi:DNA repair protein RecN (Recombination protein N)